jgi:hypothetical protein
MAPDANERSEDRPAASYIWALVIGSMIEDSLNLRSIAYALKILRLRSFALIHRICKMLQQHFGARPCYSSGATIG